MKKLIIISIGLAITVSAHAGLYRWVDDAGNVHFSDKVPASASNKSHTKLNKSGDITGQVDPSSKQKELHLKKAKEKEKELLAEIRRKKAAEDVIIKKRDNDLLSTYSDESELVNYFESKLRIIEGNSKIIESQKNMLKKKVVKLESTAKVTKHDKALKNIAKKLESLNSTLDQYDKALDENNQQISQLSESYKTDLARFKELIK